MSIQEKLQPALAQIMRDVLGPTPSDDDALDFANTLVGLACGVVFASLHPICDRHAAVAMWLKLWVETAEARSSVIEAPSHVHH